jgi:hypothetical protein
VYCLQTEAVVDNMASAGNEEKAGEWIDKAEKKLKGGFSFFSQGTKFEEAADFFIKGANLYKMAKKCKFVGEVIFDGLTTPMQ